MKLSKPTEMESKRAGKRDNKYCILLVSEHEIYDILNGKYFTGNILKLHQFGTFTSTRYEVSITQAAGKPSFLWFALELLSELLFQKNKIIIIYQSIPSEQSELNFNIIAVVKPWLEKQSKMTENHHQLKIQRIKHYF